MGIKILNTEMCDNSTCDANGNIQPSEISVLVTVMVDGVQYTLDYQTTNTNDVGAYSSMLQSYDGNSDHQALEAAIDNESYFYGLLAEIKHESGLQNIWAEYMDENYILDDGSFGGLDANSERNKAKPVAA